METQAPHWRKLILPAGFALVSAVLIVLTLHWYGGSLPLQPQDYRVSVPLRDASNLVPGSDVQISGVDVGDVADVSRAGGEALVTVELEPRYAPLRSGARVTPRTKTLLGEAYLEIAPGPPAAVPIPEGGQLPRNQVRSSVRLDEFLETFAPDTRRRFRQLFAGLSKALDGRAESLNASLGNAAPFLGNLASVIEVLDGQKGELESLFSGSADVLDALGERQGALQAAITAGNEVLDVTAQRDHELAATVREMGPFLTQLRATSRTISEASGDLNGAVESLLPAAPLVAPALEEITVAAPEFRDLFRELPATILAGNRGLPALTRMVPAARRGFQQFYPASRELIPFMQLLAVYRRTVPSVMASVGQIWNGTFVGPEGLVHRTGAAIPTVWNEIVAGWERKLPSNRPFPYPKPGALLDTAQLGYLKSYDCRHTNNPMWLPPTGTGAPPCVEQGPWEFDGRSAYYPRLHRAPP